MLAFIQRKKAIVIILTFILIIFLFAVSTLAVNPDGEEQKAIYFQNLETGQIDAWIMDGLDKVGEVAMFEGKNPAAWRIAAVHDMEGNGSPDLFWENINTGRRVAWVMDGLEVIAEIDVGTANPNFRIADLHDMDGDGNPDLIWQNIAYGSRNIWFMDGFERVDGQQFAVANPNWLIVGVDDMTGDGRTNIIWEHITRGDRNYWTLDDNYERITAESGNFFWTGTDWKIRAVHDMNGDGNPDLIWEHADGRRSIWLMDGLDRIESGIIGNRDAEWTIVGAGTVVLPFGLEIIDVETIPDIEVEIGTAFQYIPFPNDVVVTLSDNSTSTLAVLWDEESNPVYNPYVSGIYSFEGNLQLPWGIFNPDNLKAEADVIVKDIEDFTVKDGEWWGFNSELEFKGLVELYVKDQTITSDGSTLEGNEALWIVFVYDSDDQDYESFAIYGYIEISPAGEFEFAGTTEHGIHSITVSGIFMEGDDPDLPDQLVIGYAEHVEHGVRSMSYDWFAFHEDDWAYINASDVEIAGAALDKPSPEEKGSIERERTIKIIAID